MELGSRAVKERVSPKDWYEAWMAMSAKGYVLGMLRSSSLF